MLSAGLTPAWALAADSLVTLNLPLSGKQVLPSLFFRSLNVMERVLPSTFCNSCGVRGDAALAAG